MFHECKVYDGKGKLKTVYTKDQVAFSHWRNTVDGSNKFTFSETTDIPKELVKGPQRKLICLYSECKKPFITTHKTAKVCSDTCGKEVKREKDIARRRARSKDNNFIPPQEYENGYYGYKIECKECKEISYKKNYKAVFCNAKCLSRYKNKNCGGARKAETYKIVCEFCKEVAHMKSAHAIYCSAECRKKQRTKRVNITTKTW
ncbi:hypothetical protein OAW27_00135 [bacterium]|nr:hypothetical protein [bacterium]